MVRWPGLSDDIWMHQSNYTWNPISSHRGDWAAATDTQYTWNLISYLVRLVSTTIFFPQLMAVQNAFIFCDACARLNSPDFRIHCSVQILGTMTKNGIGFEIFISFQMVFDGRAACLLTYSHIHLQKRDNIIEEPKLHAMPVESVLSALRRQKMHA